MFFHGFKFSALLLLLLLKMNFHLFSFAFIPRQGAQGWCTWMTLRDGMGREVGGVFGGTHVHLWLIHVNVWQKPLQYCKVISLQLKEINKNFKKENEFLIYDSYSYMSCIILNTSLTSFDHFCDPGK